MLVSYLIPFGVLFFSDIVLGKISSKLQDRRYDSM